MIGDDLDRVATVGEVPGNAGLVATLQRDRELGRDVPPRRVASCLRVLAVIEDAGDHLQMTLMLHEPTTVDTQTGYRIKGRNPSRAQIASQASSPWYFRKIVRAESSCRQFSGGYPLKSGDNGYGLMQITNPRPTKAHIWRWTRNLARGKTILDGKIASAGGHWDKIEKAWKDYNHNNDPDIPAPPNKTYSGITIGYDTGHPLKDGIAIKKYDGTGCGAGAPAGCESGEWLDWIPGTRDTPPEWEYNEGRGYVAHLAKQPPCE